MEKTKVCIKCKGDPQPLSNFSKKGNGKYFSSYCKKCQQQRVKNWRINNPNKAEKKRLRDILRRYDITEKQYNELFKFQKGKCAICGTHQKNLNRKLGVDHDHITGEVRGLLCSACNTGLGLFKDDFELLEIASDYLQKWEDRL